MVVFPLTRSPEPPVVVDNVEAVDIFAVVLVELGPVLTDLVLLDVGIAV